MSSPEPSPAVAGCDAIAGAPAPVAPSHDVPAATATAAGRGRRRLFRGWRVAGAGAAIQALQSALIIQAFGNYAVVLQQQFGWSKTTMSVAYAFNRAESGLLGPFQGWLLDRFGARTVMRVGAVVVGMGFFAFSQVRSPLQFVLAFIVLSVGAGLSGFLTVTTTTVRWFERQRARALALISVGFAVGGLCTPALVWALRAFGWRPVAAGSGVVLCATILAASPLFAGGPADHGEVVDGLQPTGGAPDRRRSTTLGPSDHFTAREALHTRAFWMLALGHASALLVVGSVLAHLPLYLTDERGLALQEASFVAGALPLVQLIGTVLGGTFGDRADKRVLAASAMLGHMAGLLVLTYATSRWMIWSFVVLHGLSWGVRGPIMQALRADYFGSTAFGQIMGYSSMVLMVGVVGGPLFAGLLADVTGSYRLGFTILAVVCGAGLAFFALAAPPERAT